jgi:hypothetical protein
MLFLEQEDSWDVSLFPDLKLVERQFVLSPEKSVI